MFVTVIHRIHDPEGFQGTRPEVGAESAIGVYRPTAPVAVDRRAHPVDLGRYSVRQSVSPAPWASLGHGPMFRRRRDLRRCSVDAPGSVAPSGPST